jgi:flavodoxin
MKIFKRILAGLGIFIGVIILLAGTSFLVLSSANSSKGSHEEVLKSTQDSPKKALVVYQPSLSSFSGDMAHQIAKGLNDNGFEVTLNNPGDYMPSDLSQYDVVVFGSPVYAGKVSKALTDYMAKITALPSGKIVLYSTGGMLDNTIELDKMDELLNGTAAYNKIKFDANDKSGSAGLAYSLGVELSK